MPQHLLEVRVRPFRIAVLVNRAADAKDLLLGFELLSKVWGGRFGQVLAVDPETCDDLTAFRLGESRPEFVYGIGLNDRKWNEAVQVACQPRGYGQLRPEFVKGIKQSHPEDYYLTDHALIHLMRTRDTRPGRHRRLRLVSTEPTGLWPLLGGAVFGVHPPTLREEYRDEVTAFSDNTATALVALAAEFVKECQQSWLDVTGHELNPFVSGWGHLSPTVVIVREPVPDLSLFWNLRSASDADMPAWVIPVPETCLTEAPPGGGREVQPGVQPAPDRGRTRPGSPAPVPRRDGREPAPATGTRDAGSGHRRAGQPDARPPKRLLNAADGSGSNASPLS